MQSFSNLTHAICWFVFSLAACSANSAAQIRSAQDSMAYVEVTTAGGQIEGSAFLVSPKGYALTAKHVVERAKQIVVRVGGKGGQAYTVQPSDTLIHSSKDLALLKLTGAAEFSCFPVADTFTPNLSEASDRSVVLMGFPANVTFAEPDGKINTINETAGRWSVIGVADHGMSGGPIILKKTAEVVGVLVTKDQSAIGISKVEPVTMEILKDFKVTERFQQCPSLGEVVALASDASAEVRVQGTGGGGLPEAGQSQKAAARKVARLDVKGGEKSQCSDGFDRTISAANVRAEVIPVGFSELRFNIDLAAQGGHFVTAAKLGDQPLCAAGIPIGRTGNDTSTWSAAELNGEIVFSLTGGAADVEVYWTEMPAEQDGPQQRAHMRVLDPTHKEVAQWNANGSGKKTLRLTHSGAHRLLIDLSASANHKGSCCGPHRVERAATVRLH